MIMSPANSLQRIWNVLQIALLIKGKNICSLVMVVDSVITELAVIM